MSHITREQLIHLAKLTRIQLTQEDIEQLLPQMGQMLTFVGQLQEVDTSSVQDEIQGKIEQLADLPNDVRAANMTKKFLENIQHPLEGNAPKITNQLSEIS